MKLTERDRLWIEECRENGAGKQVDPELLTRYPVEAEQEYTISTSYGDCRFFVYWPSKEKHLPVFVNVHGGGFVKGRREQDIVFAKNICHNSGFVVVDVDYTPSPDMRFPGQIWQTYEVIRHLAEHAGEFGIDADRICAGGHSAGGSVVAAVAILAAEKREFNLRLQILDYAGLDLYTPARLKANGYANKRIPPEKSEFYNRMYLDEDQKLDPLASPLFAPDEMLAGLPETLILGCDTDAFRDEEINYGIRLARLGVPVTIKVFLHSNHGFVVQRKDEFEKAEQLIIRALKNAV